MKISFKLTKTNTVCLSGSITFDSVTDIIQSGYDMIDDHAELIINCKDIQQSDSSFIALVIQWLKYANTKKHKINFINVPQAIYDIATLYGLKNLFKPPNKE